MAGKNQAGGDSSDRDVGETAFANEINSLVSDVSQEIRRQERQDVSSLPSADDQPKSNMTLEQALKSESPDARAFVADHFMRSNQVAGPQRAKKLYRVDNEEPVEAFDEIEAIAVTNDRTRSLKGPHGRKVVEISREATVAG